MNPRDILKKALEDPPLEIEILTPTVYTKIALIICDLPEESLISEWFHNLLSEAKYEYHIHTGRTTNNLRDLYIRGVRGGNPRLVKLYTKKDLYDLIREPSTV